MTGAGGTRRWAAGCLVLGAVVAAGCGGGGGGGGGGGPGTTSVSSVRTGSPSSSPSSSSSTLTSRASSRARARPRVRRRLRGAPIGVTQRVHAGSSTLAVTATRIIDPLADSGSALLPGTRPLGVLVTIRNVAGATYDSTASGDWSLLTVAGAAYPLFVRRGVCQTPLVDFESLIGAGETHGGCVGFSVARRARVVGIRFSPHGRAAGAVRWRA